MTQHLSGINRYRRADMTRHDDRDIDMGGIDSEIGNERLAETFHCELRRCVSRVRCGRANAGPEPINARSVDDMRLIR